MVRFQRALALLHEHKYREAKELLGLLLSENPSDPDILYNLGVLHTEMGEPDKAIEMLSRSLDTAETRANVEVALGYAWFVKGDSTKAKAHTERALAAEPDNPYAHRNLAGVLGKLGNFREAVEHMRKAYAFLPDDPQVVYGLAHALTTVNEFEEADQLFLKVIRMKAPEPMLELAKTGRREIAEASYKAQGLRPDAVFYCLGALQRFAKLPAVRTKQIAYEIGMLGRSGLDVNNPDSRYTLRSLPGEFSGLHLLCLMYVGFKKIDPKLDIGFDLSHEYEAALKLMELGDTNGT